MDVPISLYLKTEQGEHPDLKVVARAALTFAEIIEQVARWHCQSKCTAIYQIG